MTPTEQDKELREQLQGISYKAVVTAYNTSQASLIDYAHELTEELVQLITADRKRMALEARVEPFDFVESCEPDCDDVRHAYHQGQWDMATRIKAQQDELKKQRGL